MVHGPQKFRNACSGSPQRARIECNYFYLCRIWERSFSLSEQAGRIHVRQTLNAVIFNSVAKSNIILTFPRHETLSLQLVNPSFFGLLSVTFWAVLRINTCGVSLIKLLSKLPGWYRSVVLPLAAKTLTAKPTQNIKFHCLLLHISPNFNLSIPAKVV